MPHAQTWTCKDCGSVQVLVFEGGAQGGRATSFALVPCAACEAIHEVRLPPDTDRETIRVGVLRPGARAACPVCGAPESEARSAAAVVALCENGHERTLDPDRS